MLTVFGVSIWTGPLRVITVVVWPPSVVQYCGESPNNMQWFATVMYSADAHFSSFKQSNEHSCLLRARKTPRLAELLMIRVSR